MLRFISHCMGQIRFRVKILGASDAESDCAISYTWVLSLHLYR